MADSPDHRLALDLDAWRAVNDSVMGGISQGEMIATRLGLRFQGNLSVENNGGFASVRRQIDENLDGYRGVQLRVLGDGRPYQFRVGLEQPGTGAAWRAMLDPGESEQTVDLWFQDFEPVIRGRVLAGQPPLNPANIRQLGFLVADKTPGPFRLDITGIRFLGSPGPDY